MTEDKKEPEKIITEIPVFITETDIPKMTYLNLMILQRLEEKLDKLLTLVDSEIQK